MKRVLSVLAAIGIAAGMSASARAQWLNYPTPGLPRLGNGKPDLQAPVPRTSDGRPDLSGIWRNDCSRCRADQRSLAFDLVKDLPAGAVQMTAWASAIQQQRAKRERVDDPWGLCLPVGMPRADLLPSAFRIVNSSGLTVFLYENNSGQMFREVYTDGRPFPEIAEPAWLGYSVGRWDGDTFVIEATGFRDGGWMDNKGIPHSDALRLTERFHRINVGSMEAAITIDDPKAYLKPFTVHADFRLLADTALLESSCDSHLKTMTHRLVEPAPPEPPSPHP